jgi:hypothetical protein
MGRSNRDAAARRKSNRVNELVKYAASPGGQIVRLRGAIA